MSVRRRLIPWLVFGAVLGGALVGTSRSAEAGNYIVYLHGRSMNGWPANALLGAPAGWSQVTMSYKSVTCNPMPAVAGGIPDASIVYDDADGAYAEESSPLNLLRLCGNDLWSGQPPLYATCLSAAGCCTAFSSGDAGGCACGETLCRQSRIGYRSYYTGAGCTGTEYSHNSANNINASFISFDGTGMVGEATATVTVQSARSWNDGRCQRLVHAVYHLGPCTDYNPVSRTLTNARRVYRPGGAPPPPVGNGPDLVVSSSQSGFSCP